MLPVYKKRKAHAPPRVAGVHQKVEWIFLRALALIYFVAFLSIAVQVKGLIGSQGILPAGPYLEAVLQGLHASAYWSVPTVFWFGASDAALQGTAIAGAVVSLVLLAGFAERACLVILFVLYLSFVSAGQEFLSFQWDSLLLETGFLAIFLGISNIVVWLFRWLLFRLMFLSGMVKLLSHDPTWRNLTAMTYHYWTQPLPTPLAWYMNQAPRWFLRASTASVLVIEIFVPWLIFFPRRIRMAAAIFLIFLQLLILSTGNYTFFNWLTIALCLFLFDDRALARWRFPSRRPSAFWAAHGRPLGIALALFIAVLSGLVMMQVLGSRAPAWATRLLGTMAPFNVVNSYGLFAVMTTSREEIIVQGSNDGATWQTYEFPYKPGDLRRAPPWVAPYQPRLDWQMWFAALGELQSSPWFVNFALRLLQGSPDVLALLERNPFPQSPPVYVRALLYDYHFTTFTERRATGDWWKRTASGMFLPAISLKDIQRR